MQLREITPEEHEATVYTCGANRVKLATSNSQSGEAIALEGTVGQEEVAVGRGVALGAMRELRKCPGVSLTGVCHVVSRLD